MKLSGKRADQTSVVLLMEMSNGGSDLALKKNVVEISTELEQVLKLRPVTWNWRAGSDTKLRYGFIAQEVEKVFPDLVEMKEWEDGTPRKFLSTNDMMPYLITALKEQQAQIAYLQDKLSKLDK